MTKRRVGVIGYGNLGQTLVDEILKNTEEYELAFVWNRTKDALYNSELDPKYYLRNIEDFKSYKPDLVVEVAHPIISDKYGEDILKEADYMIGSPSALANAELERKLRSAAKSHGLYVPSGAFWGGEDIKKMADLKTLKALKVTMKKHPNSLKLEESEIKQVNESLKKCKDKNKSVVLYDGPVRGICPLAPSNVNTMAAAAIAGHNLGFVGVQGCLVADLSLKDWHIIEIEVTGPSLSADKTFSVTTVRKNPADPGAVTGSATYKSFISSMKRANNKGPGVHLC
ncbi:putative L-aspartate dehydrogenase [Nymphon striatum]|nr:putative L-aspartate dehydrogenase [Nymphon striatum]